MFRYVGHAVSRGWILFLAAWVIFLVAGRLAAPPWEKVAQDKEFGFLPADAPSRRSEAMFAKAFPDGHLASSIVLVLHRTDPTPERFDEDLKFIEDTLEPQLRQIAIAEGGLASELTPSEEPLFGGDEDTTAQSSATSKRSIIARIRTPNAPGSGVLLVSPDNQALLVVIELTTDFLSVRNWPIITKIENLVSEIRQQGKVPPGLEVAMTGSAVIGRDRTKAQLDGARATELLTVVLVIVLLVLIYRAPLLALIPLATVYLAVQVALKLLAIMAQAGYVALFQGIQIYVTVLAYGAGVDYCLFLMARYKETLDTGASQREAVARAIGDVGGALTASAATVMFGIGMMIFAQFGKFHEAGIAIPLSILLTLAATLTFSPSLLRLAGRWAFWPQAPTDSRRQEAVASEPSPSFWRRLLQPGGLRRGWERVSHALLERPGRIWLTTVVLMAPFAILAGPLYGNLSYDLISDLPANAPSVAATRTLQEHFPAGVIAPVTVLITNPNIDFSRDEGRRLVGELTDRLRTQKEELELADIRSLTAPLGITPAADRNPTTYHVSEEARRKAMARLARERYVTDLGERKKIGTRFDLILQESPFAHRSVDDLNRTETVFGDALAARSEEGSQIYVVGTLAGVRDLQTVARSDRRRIELLVLVSVFVVLALLLRSVGVPVYLLLSVLFSYYATLGVSFAVFWLLDPHGFAGIDWKVAIFLFTILVAVGEDYNIFLMSRIREEQVRHGPVRGVTEALTRTGPIISSCGIIMAGTFSTLLAGSLNEMKQLGFALAFGILLDTFVVRPILVPSFLILLSRKQEREPRTHWLQNFRMWPAGKPSADVTADGSN
jgi:RND superfamily putative drug exporter